MDFVVGLLYVIFTMAALLLILMVLFRPTEGSGLSGAFGGIGGDTAFGVKATQVIDKAVMWVAGVFILLAVVLAFIKAHPGDAAAAPAPTGIQAPAEPGPGGDSLL